MKRIAILTSGGDAPGMNACIRAALRASIATGVRLYGVRHGYVGLINGDIELMDRRAVAGIIQRIPSDQGMVYPSPDNQPGDQMLQLSKVRRGSDTRVGDIVLSSGLGGVYPSGLDIGTVESVERSSFSGSSIVAYVRPFADFNHLDYVIVLPRAD